MRSSRLYFLLRRFRFRNLWLPWLLVSLLLLGLRFGTIWGAPTLAQSPDAPHAPTYQALSEIPPTAQQVQTGLYTMNLYNLDPSSNTYYLDFYIWLKWKGDLDPLTNLEFVNGVEDWGATLVPAYEEPEVLPDGSFYQIFRVESRFVQPFALARYPMDEQRLTVSIENSVYTAKELVYVVDATDSGFTPELAIPGWKIRDYELQSLLHRYGSQFGDPRIGEEDSAYSTLQYQLRISRPLSFFIWKLLLPLVIVLISGWGALLLHPSFVDSRILMPVTALLTIVFLQQSYSASLPDVGYLVLLDKIYALAYVLIISAIMEAIFTADRAHNGKPEDLQAVARIDRSFLIGQTALLTLGVLLLIML